MLALGCTESSLKFDEACVRLINESDEQGLWLYSLSSDCVMCPYTRTAMISTNSTVKFSTVKSLSWRVYSNNGIDERISTKNMSNMFCSLSPNIEQYGLYDLTVESQNCRLKTTKEPTYLFTEMFVVLGALLCILLAFSGIRSLWHVLKRRYKKRVEDRTAKKEPTKRRIKAIDTFRGISILLMIFANDSMGGYPTLGHATWNGLLVSDLVFPCFLWIMGVCIPIALGSQLRRATSKLKITFSIVKRSLLLFLIGVSLNTLGSKSQLENIRIFGVLQRFGVCYLLVSLLYLYLTRQKSKKIQVPILKEIQDILLLFPHWCFMAVILVVYCLLAFGLPVPGCPTGYFGPGGWHEDGKYWNCTGGSAGYIDKIILGSNHTFQRPAIRTVYGSGPFDPEGILGCLTSVFQVFLGVQAGIIMMTYKDWKERVIRWLLWAALLGCLGSVLHFTNVVPVNKSLWSLSFVFLTTSFALACLSACYLLVDVIQVWRGGPFRIPGMNALALYIGHMMCYQIFPFHWRIGDMSLRAICLVETMWNIALWTIIAYIMHHKRMYITL